MEKWISKMLLFGVSGIWNKSVYMGCEREHGSIGCTSIIVASHVGCWLKLDLTGDIMCTTEVHIGISTECPHITAWNQPHLGTQPLCSITIHVRWRLYHLTRNSVNTRTLFRGLWKDRHARSWRRWRHGTQTKVPPLLDCLSVKELPTLMFAWRKYVYMIVGIKANSHVILRVYR